MGRRPLSLSWPVKRTAAERSWIQLLGFDVSEGLQKSFGVWSCNMNKSILSIISSFWSSLFPFYQNERRPHRCWCLPSVKCFFAFLLLPLSCMCPQFSRSHTYSLITFSAAHLLVVFPMPLADRFQANKW